MPLAKIHDVVIYTPPFDLRCGGAVVLHRLAKQLQQHGLDVGIVCYGGAFNPDSDFETESSKENIGHRTVVVYPESIEGNPLDATCIVRWILCEVGRQTSSNIVATWGADDLVFHFGTFNPDGSLDTVEFLTVLKIDNRYAEAGIAARGKKRKGACVIIRKGHMFHGPKLPTIHPDDAVVLDDNASPEDLLIAFSIYERLYCYDPYTFHMVHAALAGCLPIVVPVEGVSKSDWINSLYAGPYFVGKALRELAGIAWGVDDTLHALETLSNVAHEQEQIMLAAQDTVSQFVRIVRNLNSGRTHDRTLPTVRATYDIAWWVTAAAKDFEITNNLKQQLEEQDQKLADNENRLVVYENRLADAKEKLSISETHLLELERKFASCASQNELLKAAVASAKAWQKRSWAKRAFHRWTEPGCKRKKVNLLKRLERSFRKRRNRLLGSKVKNSNQFTDHFIGKQSYQSESRDTPRLIVPDLREDLFVPISSEAPTVPPPVKAICFYLPQFHPIPENNEWWGEGFTEWTNVRPAKPQFEGHYQPHVPGELGYYNLLDEGVQTRQVELAKLYGIGGFCFYFYWFHGQRLLEAPILRYLADLTLDLPFCLCWANENWSRRWDGSEKDILMAQNHTSQDDLAFIEYISIYLRDSRYIRVGGKPLILLYRPSLLPNIAETAHRWRVWCRENGIGEIYLAYTQSFDKNHPADFGFDGAVEFPPNNTNPRKVSRDGVAFDEAYKGKTYDICSLSEQSGNYSKPDYKLFRSVCPSWDNTARKKRKGAIFCNGSPSVYLNWLKNAVRYTIGTFPEPDERLVFINAWNEWAEGAHLEPDAKYGYAYLQATRDALLHSDPIPQLENSVVIVVHDAFAAGAQMIALHIARTLNSEMGFEVDIVCLGEGPLMDEFCKYGTLHLISNEDSRSHSATELARRLAQSGKRRALVNSTVSGFFLETLAKEGITCVAMVHELKGILEKYSLKGQATSIANHATKIVFPADLVSRSFAEFIELPAEKMVILPQGLYKKHAMPHEVQTERQQLRENLKIPSQSKIVLGIGYADHRKGIDLFVEAGLILSIGNPHTYFVWVGHWDERTELEIQGRIEKFPLLKHHFIFPGRQESTSIFYMGADVFAMTSREDPFPSVVLEAMHARLPIVGFKGALGLAHHIESGCGILVELENVAEYANALKKLLDSPDLAESMGRKGAEIVASGFSQRHYVFNLLEILGCGLKKVSVIVPNSNDAENIEQRIKNVTRQSYPVFEIILLDDFSADNSVKIAKEILDREGIDYRVIVNDQNSGSASRQRVKGVASCIGEYVWIAEADDTRDPAFLSEVINGSRHLNVSAVFFKREVISGGSVLSPKAEPLVSVIVPNYNHSKFLSERLSSIADQTYKNLEIILLDDKSTDSSLDHLKSFVASDSRAKLKANAQNSGSTFKQWRKGLAEASGKYVWIAESDDSAHSEFVEKLVARLEANNDAVLAACCPRMTDIKGNNLGIPKDWFGDIGGKRWEADFSSHGLDEIRCVLSQKNSILNASGVVFRNLSGIVDLVDDTMRLCADWLFWIRLLSRGNFEYVAQPLNYWRLASSNARTRPPGETEWIEGSRILEEVASTLDLSDGAKGDLLANFRKRCDQWLRDSKANTPVEENLPSGEIDNAQRAKIIAIHLPQFHPFKENNEWWGDGFTEWTNVRKAIPLFESHDQPRIPTALGYYDLRDPAARAAQADLARKHGIDGFCYYHYWFNGHRLMNEPIDAILKLKEPNFPFCFCWANETWSRRWLGEERDILIEQTYSKADNINHAKFLAKVFEDKRYIRINGQPLFVIYRPKHINILDHFITTLREICIESECGNPFILGCSSHAEGLDMRTLGMDGTFDFQPKLGFLPEAFDDSHSLQRRERNRSLGIDSANLRLYDTIELRKEMESHRNDLKYPVHPSIFVDWDNTPRRGDKGIVILKNSPEILRDSLEQAQRYLDSDKFSGEKVIFINAWNEWAEGNHLEPDIQNETGFLDQVAKFKNQAQPGQAS